MSPARVFAAASTESPAPTDAQSFKEPEPGPADAAWPWAYDLGALTDRALRFSGTPLLLPHHGNFARGIRGKPLVDVDVTIVIDESTHRPTTPGAENVTEAVRLGADWAAMIRRLLRHHLPELRSLWSQTSVRVMFEEPVPRDLVPLLRLNVARHAQPLEKGAASKSTPVTRDAIGAGRDLHAGLRAVDDLRRWLSLTVADIALIAGLSESTIYWWAEHPTSIPRPAKLDRLLGLQALVWGLVEDLGEAMTRQWFRAGHPSPLDRLRRDPGALPAIEAAGYMLLQRLANRRLAEAGPGHPVTDDDDRRDLARLAKQEHDLKEPLAVEELDSHRLEPRTFE